MLNPFIDLISSVIHIYTYVVIAWVIFATLISFKIINGHQILVQRIMFALDRLCEPVLKRIRRYMPNLGGIDLSPIVLFLLLNFVDQALYTYFYSYG